MLPWCSRVQGIEIQPPTTAKLGAGLPHDGRKREGVGQDSWVEELVSAEAWSRTEHRPCEKTHVEEEGQ